jgi:hypothetical protein
MQGSRADYLVALSEQAQLRLSPRVNMHFRRRHCLWKHYNGLEHTQDRIGGDKLAKAD